MFRLSRSVQRVMLLALLVGFVVALAACEYHKTDSKTGKRYQIDREEYEDLNNKRR